MYVKNLLIVVGFWAGIIAVPLVIMTIYYAYVRSNCRGSEEKAAKVIGTLACLCSFLAMIGAVDFWMKVDYLAPHTLFFFIFGLAGTVYSFIVTIKRFG